MNPEVPSKESTSWMVFKGFGFYFPFGEATFIGERVPGVSLGPFENGVHDPFSVEAHLEPETHHLPMGFPNYHFP